MTTANKWTLGAVGAVVLVLVASWFLLVSPQLSQASELSEQTQSQENANAQLQTEISVLEAQFKDLPQKQAQLKQLDQQIPATDELPVYIQDLTAAAGRSGVAMASVTPTATVPLVAPGAAAPAAIVPGQGLPTGQLSAINIDIVVNGGFFEIQEFVNGLEGLERYTLVSGLTVAEAESTGTESNVGELTATVNARIYLVPQPAEGTTDGTVATETTGDTASATETTP